jgi:hypothetical protein
MSSVKSSLVLNPALWNVAGCIFLCYVGRHFADVRAYCFKFDSFIILCYIIDRLLILCCNVPCDFDIECTDMPLFRFY